MRQTRKLAQNVWYEIRSRINNREPLFRRSTALALFDRVFAEAALRFPFEARGLRIEDDLLAFYIRPEDGMRLPAVMQWVKQTFAQRYNALTGRTGHIWGDRYWSLILEGEPPEGAAGLERAAGNGVRPRRGKRRRGPHFPALSALARAPPPGFGA
jgi:REP element-mobilizing transposase RayT